MTRDEITFIYLSTYLSGIQIDVQSYSGVPELDSKKLIEFESWYKENKDRIIWDRVKKGLEILRSTQIDQKQIKELESLKIN
jgi:predicted membrane-bound dolichyl-phosphate-mannose-protein mannosyltransferase